jgi:ADP-ribose pyrophosphatase YjhB (NUDIX family)/predicted nucleotidyltransferase
MEFKNVNIAITNNGKFLLLKRSEKESYTGMWEFPAGKVNDDENSLDAIIRETFEETGIKLKKGEIKKVGETWRPRKGNKGYDAIKTTMFTYSHNDTDIKLSEEHSSYKWFDLDEIKKNTDNIGFETIRCINRMISDKTISIYKEEIKKVFSKKYREDEIGVMLVGSASREDFLNNWSDIDVVVLFNKKEIEYNDILKLREINSYLNSLGHQVWFKVHTLKDFPKKYEQRTIRNYNSDGIQLFGINVKEFTNIKFDEEIIIKEGKKKIENFQFSPRFWFRYYSVSTNNNNQEFLSIHVTKDKRSTNKGDKLRIAKLIDMVLDVSHFSLFYKNIIPTGDKFYDACNFAIEYDCDIPFQLLALRERLWLGYYVSNEKIEMIEKMCFDFFEEIYPKIVGE